MGILNGIRILDFTWALAGPYATRLLADFGVEVIKVQSPLMKAEDNAFARNYYNSWNRNKLGITLNLNRLEGIALAKRLINISDVVIENFTPRVLANWRLNYANLKKFKPDIILVSLSVMGQKSNFNGYGPTVHALSGLTRLTSFPGGLPVGPGFSYADHVAGLYASLKLMEALEERRKTGRGQHIGISEVDIMKYILPDNEKLEPVGNDSPAAVPHDAYLCRDDRWCAIAVFSEEEWSGLKKAMGSPVWADDEKFISLSSRLENRDELNELISGWTRLYTASEVMSRLQKSGVAAGIVQDANDIAKDPQLKERGFFIKHKPAALVDAIPIRMSVVKAEYKKSAPSPGADNDFVYGKLLDIGKKELVRLKESKVI